MMMNKDVDKLLHSLYYNPASPASFSGVERLYKHARLKSNKITIKSVKDWLSGEIPYTLHKGIRRRFKRNPIIVSNIDEQWQADLVDMQEFSKKNNGYKYILTVIDIFSKYAWAIPLKDKRGLTVTKAFSNIFKDRKPIKLQTDKGREFRNKELTNLLKKYDIHYFTSKNDIKCSIVERFNRTLKSRMFKYFTSKGTRKYHNVIKELVKSYNYSRNRSIKCRPIDVNESNKEVIFKNLYGYSSKRELFKSLYKKSKLKRDDLVRKQYKLGPFDKSYFPLWTDDIYKVKKSIKGINKPFYQIKNESGNELDERYYPEQLQKIKNPIHRIEKIIKRRVRRGGIEYYIKWLNHPTSLNSWIPASNIQNIS